MKMSICFSLFFILMALKAWPLEYSKIEFDGCPENAFCKKETGANRKKWIEELKKFSSGKINEEKINTFVQSEYGLPMGGWGQEEASLRPNLLMWDSPCKQHRVPNNKYYIAEIFRKNLNPNELKELPNIFFSRAILTDNSNQPYTMVVPRGDAPLFIKDGSLYYLREEEGLFYGLLINRNGSFKVTKIETSQYPPKESICTKEQVDLFNRESPGPNFYQGTTCKALFDKSTKNYKTILLGWSCH